jgi:ATP-dependent DNA helicase RecG
LTILSNSPQFLKGVGPKRALILERLGLRSLGDLLYYLPRDWQDRRQTQDLTLPTATGLAVVRGLVTRAGLIPAGRSLALYKATLATGEAKVDAVWFKHLSRRFDVFSSLKKEVAKGDDVWVVGRADASLVGIKEIQVDEHYRADDERWALHVDRLTPIYPSTEGLSQRFWRELLFEALGAAAASAPEILPATLLARRGLLSAPQALKGIHFPGSQAELDAARGRLAYEELLLLELAWILKRRQTTELRKGFSYEIKRSLLTPFRQQLGF